MALFFFSRRRSTLLLLAWLALLENNGTFLTTCALRVGTSDPRRRRSLPRSRATKPFSLPIPSRRSNNNNNNKNEAPAQQSGRKLSELRVFVSDASPPSSHRDNARRATSLTTRSRVSTWFTSHLQRQQQQSWLLRQLRRPLTLGVAACLVFVTLTASSLEGLLRSYNLAMTARPLLTKVVTGAVLALLGDALAQAGSSSTNDSSDTTSYDARRAASFAAFDSCYRVFQHLAFPFIIAQCQGRVLARALSLVTMGGTAAAAASASSAMLRVLAVCERVLAYQMVVVPCLYYPVFFTFTGFLQGLTVRQTAERAVTNFLPCWKRNLMFWIPIQAIMFGFVSEKWQVPFVCVMGIVWSSILSVTAGKAHKK